MKKLFLIVIFAVLSSCNYAYAQDVCPVGQVCLPQATANRLLQTVEQLIAAKDTINKLMNERGASDAVIASAQRVIADYADLDKINGMIVLKYKDVIALYERTLAMYGALVQKLETQINKPKTSWQKLVHVLERIADIALGAAIGRALP